MLPTNMMFPPPPALMAQRPMIQNTKQERFQFEEFLEREHQFGLNPDRPKENIHPNFSNKIVCKHWLRGLCKKNFNCEFLHEYNLRKMPECLFFSKNGFCTQSPECLYLHIDPKSKIPECDDYTKGFCKEGPNCPKRHVRRTVCPYFLYGFCPDGPNCEMSHPKISIISERLRFASDDELFGINEAEEKTNSDKTDDEKGEPTNDKEDEAAEQNDDTDIKME